MKINQCDYWNCKRTAKKKVIIKSESLIKCSKSRFKGHSLKLGEYCDRCASKMLGRFNWRKK